MPAFWSIHYCTRADDASVGKPLLFAYLPRPSIRRVESWKHVQTTSIGFGQTGMFYV